MKCLDRYIIGEFGSKFLLFFVILNVFLFSTDIYTHLEKFLACNISFKEMFQYYAAHTMVLLPLTIPLTFVITLIFSFWRMHRNQEIMILLSSGMSFFRLTRIFWLLGVIASFVLILINFYGIPKSQEYANHYLEHLDTRNVGKQETMYVKHLTLNTVNRLWYINRYDKNTANAFGIAVHDYDIKGIEFRRITAEFGHFNEGINAWILEHGREILFHPKTKIADEVHVFDRRQFDELDDSPELMVLLKKPIKSFSLPQLKKVIENEIQRGIFGNANYRMRFWDIILGSIFCCLSCWIILPLLFSNPRESSLLGVTKVIILLFLYKVISYIVYVLGENGTIHWLLALLIPIVFISVLPLLWIRKLL